MSKCKYCKAGKIQWVRIDGEVVTAKCPAFDCPYRKPA
jgi:hypothetical protein